MFLDLYAARTEFSSQLRRRDTTPIGGVTEGEGDTTIQFQCDREGSERHYRYASIPVLREFKLCGFEENVYEYIKNII